MAKLINKNFVNMVRQGIVGAILGILAGQILGLLIYGLQFLSVFVYAGTRTELPIIYFFNSPTIPSGLGAGFGAIIGSIFGAISALHEQKK